MRFTLNSKVVKRCFCTAIRPGFDSTPSLLKLNTGINPLKKNNINDITNCAENNGTYFPGRIPLIGVCEDGNSSYMTGSQDAPNIIRKAFLCSSGSFDQYYCKDKRFVNTETALIDCGNIEFDNKSNSQLNHENTETLITNIYNINARYSRNEGYFPYPLVALGGDHSITYPIISGLTKSEALCGGKIGVIHFDAHPDLYPYHVIDANNPYSHASPLYNLFENNIINELLQIGIRCMTKGQEDTLNKYNNNIQQLHMEQLFGDYNDNYYQILSKTMNNWLRKCKENDINNYFISIDMDVLEPAFCPGLSHYEPFGLSTKELFIALDIIMKIIHSEKTNMIIGCDIVEYNPSSDFNYISAFVAARLLKRFVANTIHLAE